MMSPIKSLYGRRTTAGIINIPSVSGCGFLPNSASSFLLPGLHFSLLDCHCYQTLLARNNTTTVILHRCALELLLGFPKRAEYNVLLLSLLVESACTKLELTTV